MFYTLAIGFVSGFWSPEIAKVWIQGSTVYLTQSLFLNRPLFLNFFDRLQKGIVGSLAAFTYYTIFGFTLPRLPTFIGHAFVAKWGPIILPSVLAIISTIHPEIVEQREQR
jgi:hypothetical protein